MHLQVALDVVWTSLIWFGMTRFRLTSRSVPQGSHLLGSAGCQSHALLIVLTKVQISKLAMLTHFKILFVSYLLASHWLKHVTGLNLKVVKEGVTSFKIKPWHRYKYISLPWDHWFNLIFTWLPKIRIFKFWELALPVNLYICRD